MTRDPGISTVSTQRQAAATARPDLRLVPGTADCDTSAARIRVLIAGGQPLARAGHRALLASHEDIEVVGEAATCEEAVALATAMVPDVVLLDQGLPGLDEPEATFAIASHPAFACAAVLLLAAADGDERVLGALRAGAAGVLRKDDQPVTLIESVRLLAQGQALLPASAVRRLLGGGVSARSLHRTRLTRRIEELTEREREVVGLAAEGLTNHEIAARLVISPATAKTHISRAMLKLRARHRAELVVFAYEIGLAPSSELPVVA